MRKSRGQRTEVRETQKRGEPWKGLQGRRGRRGVSVRGLHPSLGHVVHLGAVPG